MSSAPSLRYRLRPFVPDLLDVQRQSFIEFLTVGIARSLWVANPICAPRHNLKIVLYPDLFRLSRPSLSPQEALVRNRTYDTQLYVPARAFLGDEPVEAPCWLHLGNIPLMTNRGHFIFNGSSRVIVNQVVRRPGVYFKEKVTGKGFKAKRVIFADFICRRGAWVRVQCDKRERFWVCLKHTPKLNLDDFIAALEVVENHTVREQPLSRDAAKVLERIEERLEFQATAEPGEAAYRFLSNRFKNPKVYNLGRFARHQINRKLHLASHSLQLTSHDLRRAKRHLLDIIEGSKDVDDIDNLANRRVRPAGDLFEMQLEVALTRLERGFRQRLDRTEHIVSARFLIEPKFINQSFREFFGSSNPLAQYLEQLNPLSDITHKRRINATGPGGVNRDNANLAMRNIHPTHYGRICPIETPEGKNAGLVNTLTVFGRVTSHGYIETPYYRVSRGQIQRRRGPVFFTTPQEQSHGLRIAPPDLNRDMSGMLPPVDLPARVSSELEEDFVRVNRTEIDYIGIAPPQLTSIATSLIPFLEHDDANRALMGSNMQRQTVPLMRPERPIVSTGLEGLVVGESGHTVQAVCAGIVSYVSGSKVVIQGSFTPNQHRYPPSPLPVAMASTCPGFSILGAVPPVQVEAYTALDPAKPTVQWPRPVTIIDRKVQQYRLQTYTRSNQETALVQRPTVSEGDWVQPGDLLADCAASIKGCLALGHNLLVAYMPWEGYNFEDAVVISERLIFDDLYTTIHIEKFETEVHEIPGTGFEVITKKLLPKISARDDEALDDDGIVRVGRWVTTGDILIGKMVPTKPQPVSPYQRIAFDIMGVEIPKTKDVSLRVPNNVHGRVVNTGIIDSENIDSKLMSELLRIRNRYLRKLRATQAGMQGGSLPWRIPLKVRVFIAEKRRIQVGDKVAGRHGNKGIISCVLTRQDMPYLADGTPVDMVLNPLGVPSRMNVGQVFECLLGLAGSYLGYQFRVTPFDELFGAEASRSLVYLKLYQARLRTKQRWLFQPEFPGKTRVFDGRTGECFDQFVTVGKAYMLKLVHLVEEKIHARATGNYAVITQQPLGGRARKGGQRLGEMEVWALEAYGAAYTLQELLTRKSDDMLNRATVIDSVMKPMLKADFTELNTVDSDFNSLVNVHHLTKPFTLGTSEAFRVLLLELQSLCLDVGIYALTAPILDPITAPRASHDKIEICDPRGKHQSADQGF